MFHFVLKIWLQVMDMLLKTHSNMEIADDDPQMSYLISAWTRICKLLGMLLISLVYFHTSSFSKNFPV